MDDRVGLDGDVRLDPGRRGIDDGDPGLHVPREDPVAQLRRRPPPARPGCSCLRRHGGPAARYTATARPSSTRWPHGVGQVELALGVVGVEPARAPSQSASAREDVDGRVDLADRQLLRASRRAPRRSRAAARPRRGRCGRTAARLVRLEREHGHRGALAAGAGSSSRRARRPRAAARRRRGRATSPEKPSSAARADGDRVAGAARRLLDGELDRRPAACPRAPARVPGEQTTTSGLRPELAGRRDRPVDEAPAEERVQVLRAARAHARAEACGHHDRCERSAVTRESWLGREDSNLRSRDQNPLPYHLATPHRRSSIGRRPALTGGP